MARHRFLLRRQLRPPFDCDVVGDRKMSGTTISASAQAAYARRPSSGDEVEAPHRQLHLATAFAGDHRHHLFGKDLHLLLDLLRLETAEFEPAEEAEVVIAALLPHLHDLVDDELL